LKLTETQTQVLKGGLKGAVRGGAAGATAAIASGAAVLVTAPAWLPFLGGSMLVAGSTLAIWSVIGSGAGAATGGAMAYVQAKQREDKFHKTFGE